MTWIVLIALAALVFALLLLLLRRDRSGWEALAAALMVGLAGYAVQGRPGMPSAPKPPHVAQAGDGGPMVDERQHLSGRDPTANKWMIVADALARQGNYADAATVLSGAVQANPRDSEGWLALANALVGHAEGNLSPGALYAFRHAAAADPQAPGPPFFLGLAMARQGRFDETRALWTGLLARAPANAPWRGEVEMRVERLDKLMGMIRQQQAQQQGGPQAQAGAFPSGN